MSARRLLRPFLAAVVVVAAIAGARAALPGTAVACSCARSEVAKFAGDPAYVIVHGLVTDLDGGAGPAGGQAGMLTVWRVFQGDVAAARIRVVVTNLCVDTLEHNMQLVAVGKLEGEVFAPNMCGPLGDTRDAGGQAVFVEAVAALGAGRGFGEAPGPPGESDFIADLAFLAVGGAAAIVVALLLIAGWGALRRERPVPPS